VTAEMDLPDPAEGEGHKIVAWIKPMGNSRPRGLRRFSARGKGRSVLSPGEGQDFTPATSG